MVCIVFKVVGRRWGRSDSGSRASRPRGYPASLTNLTDTGPPRINPCQKERDSTMYVELVFFFRLLLIFLIFLLS